MLNINWCLSLFPASSTKIRPLPALHSISPFIYPSLFVNGNYTFSSLSFSVDSSLSLSRKPQDGADGGLSVYELK